VAVSETLLGAHFRYPEYYVVGREKIREYATAVKNEDAAFFSDDAATALGYDGLIGPLTFISIFGYRAQRGFLEHVGISITDQQIVQVDQVLKFVEPITAGDTLWCDVYLEEIRKAHGTDIIVMKTVVSNGDGVTVQECFTTLAGRSEEEGESGFNDGTA
jgi:hypothetical protein